MSSSRPRVQQRTRSENPTQTPSCWRSPPRGRGHPRRSSDWPGPARRAPRRRLHRCAGRVRARATRRRSRRFRSPSSARAQTPDAAAAPRRGRHRHPHPDGLRDGRGRRARPRTPALWTAAARGRRASAATASTATRAEAPKTRASRVIVHGTPTRRRRRSRPRQATADAVALVKDLVAIPAEWLGPADFAAARRRLGRGSSRRRRGPRRGRARASGGFGGILGVGQGSDRPPRLVRLDYAPADADAARRARRQGHHLRHRRPLAEARGVDGRHEVRHVRRGDRPRRAPRRRDASALPVQGDGVAVHRRQHAVGPRDAPGRRAAHARRHDRRGAQHRCRGPPRARRRTRRRQPRASRRDHRRRHAHRCHHDRARHAPRRRDGRRRRRRGRTSPPRAEAGELAWQLPLPAHMVDDLDSPIADLQNAKIGDPAGGSLFAGLFLRHFVGRTCRRGRMRPASRGCTSTSPASA